MNEFEKSAQREENVLMAIYLVLMLPVVFVMMSLAHIWDPLHLYRIKEGIGVLTVVYAVIVPWLNQGVVPRLFGYDCSAYCRGWSVGGDILYQTVDGMSHIPIANIRIG